MKYAAAPGGGGTSHPIVTPLDRPLRPGRTRPDKVRGLCRSPADYDWSGRVIRYDTRCYFNVRSKADISQLNLPHGRVRSGPSSGI